MYLVLMQILKSFLGLVCPYLGPKIMQPDASQKKLQMVEIRPRLFENQPWSCETKMLRNLHILDFFFHFLTTSIWTANISNVGYDYELMTYP